MRVPGEARIANLTGTGTGKVSRRTALGTHPYAARMEERVLRAAWGIRAKVRREATCARSSGIRAARLQSFATLARMASAIWRCKTGPSIWAAQYPSC